MCIQFYWIIVKSCGKHMNFVFKKCINVNIEQGFFTWKLRNVSIICTRLCLLPSSRDKKQLRLSGMKVSFYQTIHWFFFEKLQFVSIILECVCCPFRGKKQLRLWRIKGSFHKKKNCPKKTVEVGWCQVFLTWIRRWLQRGLQSYVHKPQIHR